MSNFYDRIARYYEAENQTFTDDLLLYEEIAADYAEPILDVGCGTGRVNLHLAQAGTAIVGVDSSAPMLAIARRKLSLMPHLADHARLVEADIMQFHESGFGLILLPYNALMHFASQAEQIAVLHHLKSLLADDGALVIDLPNAGEAYGAEDIGGVVLERTFVEPESGNVVMQQSVSTIDRAAQQLAVTWIYDEIMPDQTLKRTLAPLLLRYVFPAELDLMLQMTGFSVIERYGDYERGDFMDGCDRLIVVAECA